MFNGDAGQWLGSPERMQRVPLPRVPCTVVAGTAGLRGRWLPFGHEPNDGVVALSETRLGAGEELITLPIWHTFMMDDRRVQQIVRERCLPQASRPRA